MALTAVAETRPFSNPFPAIAAKSFRDVPGTEIVKSRS
jgi:hypothetical protein